MVRFFPHLAFSAWNRVIAILMKLNTVFKTQNRQDRKDRQRVHRVYSGIVNKFEGRCLFWKYKITFVFFYFAFSVENQVIIVILIFKKMFSQNQNRQERQDWRPPENRFRNGKYVQGWIHVLGIRKIRFLAYLAYCCLNQVIAMPMKFEIYVQKSKQAE